ARTLWTQLAFSPSIETRYRSPAQSATTTGNEIRRPDRRPGTSRVTARRGESSPAENWTAEIRLRNRANVPGRSPRYSHRFARYSNSTFIGRLRVGVPFHQKRHG